ncbi:amino acid ABC transporter membrane protein 1 (PAAT family) [Planifilum fimeticola]|uniref:Amino acid ABC transporter membrane protein 1 (PAAT family) n=1 Tax=Planifilum fimeticola TaxID=201975 RepID=A0A2T0LDA0_9BACL|nr:ectoine/hydroxyectoine ABC transporter permease subunit EhuC [Planifilum fimeticola]PRX40025.1 amino acid ABC transporter membrane protein 1 (PAAT family) [Planifilum fimeticola]
MVAIGILFQAMPSLVQGMVVTLQVLLYSSILAFIFSFLAGFGRLSRWRPLRWATGAVVEFFRGTSLLVQLYWLYFALPVLTGINLPSGLVGILAFTLNYGSYGSEVVRSAILAIPRGQHEAGIALNMTPAQRMRSIILPQAFRIMLPSFGNLLIEMLKGTALLSLIFIPEMTNNIIQMRNTVGHTPQLLGLLLIGYFVIGYLLTKILRWVENRFRTGRAAV